MCSPQVPKDSIINDGDGHFAEEALATQTKAVGIIHPPPDIRSIVVSLSAAKTSDNGLELVRSLGCGVPSNTVVT
eukprot:9495242-Pyramimonas_sp.AAC.2